MTGSWTSRLATISEWLMKCAFYYHQSHESGSCMTPPDAPRGQPGPGRKVETDRLALGKDPVGPSASAAVMISTVFLSGFTANSIRIDQR